MSKVYINRIESYDYDLIQSTILSYLQETNLLNTINQDTTIFIKLNLLGPFSSSLAITTNPIVLDCLLSILTKYTSHITVGDNPAVRDQVVVMKKCDLYEVIQKYNCSILDSSIRETIHTSQYKLYSSFDVSKQMIDCDLLINLPKMKTHSLAYITCAEKNFFGLIHGLEKSTWHAKASNPLDFGNAMNDLFSALLETRKGKPLLTIADGIEGLEGEGPSTGGKQTKANCLMASLDAISIDRIAVEVMGLDYKKSYINTIANERAIGEGNIENIELIGASLSDFDDIHFLPPKDSLSNIGIKFLKIDFLKSMFYEHPLIDKNKCIKCGECAKICPPKAMQFTPGENPYAIKKTCIRCWCCAEVCPKNAIYKSKRPLLGRIVIK